MDCDTPAQTILNAVRSGDVDTVRLRLPEFLLTNEDRIRSIARRKLTQATRAVYDSEDVLSTVLRRMDAFVADGRFAPTSEDEIWGLIAVIARNAAVSKVRLVSRLNQLISEDGEYARLFLDRAAACETDDEAAMLVTRMSMWLPDAASRQLFNLRLRGAAHPAAATLLQITPAAARQRWKTIKDLLVERMRTEGWL